jgi:hypothetical protein
MVPAYMHRDVRLAGGRQAAWPRSAPLRRWRGFCLAAAVALGVAPGTAGAAAPQPAQPAAPDLPVHHRARHHHHYRRHPPPPLASLRPSPRPAADYTEAPRPRADLLPPKEAIPPSTAIVPGNLQLHYPPSGEGYVRGSSPQAMDDERTAKFPGVTLHVPLENPAPQPLPPPTDPGP